MGRFYQTSQGQYSNFAYQLPYEMMMGAVQFNDQMIQQQQQNLGEAEAKYLAFDALNQDEEAKKNILEKYEGRFNDLTKQISKDPLNWRNRTGDISNLGRELYKDWTRGDIKQITDNLNARNTFIKNWQEMQKSDPEKYRNQDFQTALNYFDQSYKGFKGEDGSYNDYTTEALNPYVDVESFAETLGKGYLADVIEKGGWWKNEKDGYYYHSNNKTERVTKEEIQKGLTEALKNDPAIWDYHNQMKKFYGDKGEDFSKNYVEKLYNAIDRVSDKYSYTKTESDTNQMQVDQYTMMKKKQEAEDLIKKAKMNPIQKMHYLLSQKKDKNEHNVSEIVARMYPSSFDLGTIYERKEGLQLSINDIQGKLKQVDKNKDPNLYNMYMEELGEQKALLDNTNNFINNSITLAEKFFPANQIAEIEMYTAGRNEFNKILDRGDHLQKLIKYNEDKLKVENRLFKPFDVFTNKYFDPRNKSESNSETNVAIMNEINNYKKEFKDIEEKYNFAKKNKARYGIITDYIEKRDPEFLENNTVNYQAIDLTDMNEDKRFTKSLDNILLKQKGDIKFYKMNDKGVVTMDEEVLTMNTFNQGGFSINPFKKNNLAFVDVKDNEGLNPSDILNFHNVFIGQDATGNPTLNFVVSSNNKIKVNDPDKYVLGNAMTSYTDNFVMSIPVNKGSDAMSLFLDDENPQVQNIAYMAQDPMSIMAFNSILKLPRESDYYTEEPGDNLGIRGPVQTLSLYGGALTLKVNTIGTGGGNIEYEIQPVGEDVPSDLNSAIQVDFNFITDLFKETKNKLYSK